MMKVTHIVLGAFIFACGYPMMAMDETGQWNCEFFSFAAQVLKEAVVSISFKCGGRPEVNRLFAAIRTKNVTEVATVLAEHPGLADSAQDEDGMSPLLAATIYGDAGITAILLQHGHDIHRVAQKGFAVVPRPGNNQGTLWQPLKGFTPLMAAAKWNQINIAKQLVNAGAKKDAHDDGGNTALCYAKELGDINMINLLS